MRTRVWLCAAALAFSIGGGRAVGSSGAQAPAAAGAVSIRLNPGDGDELGRATFDVLGLDAKALVALGTLGSDDGRWREVFAVTADGVSARVLEADPQALPMVGRYALRDEALRFTPRFPLERGVRYRAVFRPDRIPGATRPATGPVTALYSLPPERAAAPTEVEGVDPAVEVVPENLLRLYLRFSAPMSRGEVYQRVRLLDDTQRAIELPFLELGEELWDPSGRRLTLLLDPGRIKHGLVPHKEAGPVLEAGRSYTLEIDRQWPDAQRRALRTGFRKSFRVGPAARGALEPAEWRIAAPRAGTREAVRVAFPAPLDRALVERVLSVAAKGTETPIAGRVRVDADAKAWSFEPARAWEAGEYAVRAGTTLEDLAGNRIGRPFEVDATSEVTYEILNEAVEVPFRVEGGR